MEIKIDDGFQFGLGVFETIALEQGRPVFLKEHLRRMQTAADFFDWGEIADRGLTEEGILQWMESQAKGTAEKGQREATAKCLVHGGLKIMLSKENLILSLRENHYHPAQYKKGFTMDFSTVRRNETSPLVVHKTMNYGDCILEKRAAAKAGIDERIFLNTKGQIAEGCVSNIFFVRNGKVCTPALSCGLLPGIMRAYVLQTTDATETILYPEELADCEECFVTNSLMGIMPVRQLGKYTFSSGKTAEQLMEQYREAVKTS